MTSGGVEIVVPKPTICILAQMVLGRHAGLA